MIASRRDYLLRLIEEVAQALARATTLRKSARELEALQSVVSACERLFGLEADKLFQLTTHQQFALLTDQQLSDEARDRVLLYSALNREAALAYTALSNPAMARASYSNALRFALLSRIAYGSEGLPDFAPSVDELLKNLQGAPIDSDLSEMLKAPAE